MKIDSINQHPLSSLTSQETHGQAEARAQKTALPAAPPETPERQDTVRLSDRSRLIARAQEIVNQTPEVRTEKVEDIKSRLAAGTYNVSGRVVADSILKNGLSEII